ncbi:MAG: GIDE domain-containing protein [Bacteroidota bacterium]
MIIAVTLVEVLKFLFGGGIFLGLGLLLCYHGLKRYNLYTLIRDTPTSKIRSMPTGPVEVKGEVESCNGKYLEDPLKGEQNLLVRFKIERETEDQDGDKDWTTVTSLTEHVPFYLNDGTGRAKVVPDDDLKLQIGLDKISKTKYPEKNEHLFEYIKSRDDISDGIIRDSIKESDGKITKYLKKNKERRRYKFKQWTIKEGEELYLFGHANRLQTGSENGKADMKLTSGKRDYFFISDQEEENLLEYVRKKLPLYFIFGAIFIGVSGIFFYQIYKMFVE